MGEVKKLLMLNFWWCGDYFDGCPRRSYYRRRWGGEEVVFGGLESGFVRGGCSNF